MVVYLNTLPEIDHTVTHLTTACCCLGLITTQKADKEQRTIILKKDELRFRNLILKENFDPKVTISRVLDGDGTVTSVSVTFLCPRLGFNLGVEKMANLLEGNILGIQGIQRVFEYNIVCVDNETLERDKERSSTTKVDDGNGQFEVDEVAEKL